MPQESKESSLGTNAKGSKQIQGGQMREHVFLVDFGSIRIKGENESLSRMSHFDRHWGFLVSMTVERGHVNLSLKHW
ncbi:uncharacterized protein G2W53_039356 [Senna tora]|uniref:Uncharacterized protein n=1 Tax=Senna tora TaxID=362788 RepID=A0A834SQK8_9FABA|nr:uncharacterized protein G2W53_039356 [Senna tora]